MDELNAQVGITPMAALGVAIAAAVMYAVLAVVLRIWGRRLAVSASTVSVALVTLISAIAARAVLGHTPTVMGGLIAIATLLLLEQVFGQWGHAIALRRTERWSRSPVVLMVGAQVRERTMRKHGITETELRSRLRQQGIVSRADVGLVILEPRGSLSVVRAGTILDRDLMVGVEGIGEVPVEMFQSPDGPEVPGPR